ncbi:MAG: hypothetical protein IT559_04410 [Alphaproteobacteria bacterium]|nr:hypothetical protein [Alphaproteobacteria bacterium]
MLLDFFDPEEAVLKGLSAHKEIVDFTLPEDVVLDKFVASSSLQKSLRRKDLRQAVFAASVLKKVDEAYLFRRLKCCALEDIGPADLDVVAQVLWVSGKQDWMQRHGGAGLILSYLLHRLTSTKACRALDDQLYTAAKHPLYDSQREVFSGMTQDELLDKFTDPGLDVVEQALIAWFLCGARYPCGDLALRKGNPDLLLDLCNGLGVPPFVSDILRLSRQFEFYVSLLPAWMQIERSQTVSVTDDVESESVMISPYPAESFDRHTMQGKRAFRLFLKRCPEVSGLLQNHAPGADPANLVGWAVFILEGQLLRQRLVYEGSECLRELAAQSWLFSGGMGIEMQEEFLNLMKQHMGKLHDARR